VAVAAVINANRANFGSISFRLQAIIVPLSLEAMTVPASRIVPGRRGNRGGKQESRLAVCKS